MLSVSPLSTSRFSGKASVAQDFIDRRSVSQYRSLYQALAEHQDHIVYSWPEDVEMEILLNTDDQLMATLTYRDLFGQTVTYFKECADFVKKKRESYSHYIQRVIKVFDGILADCHEDQPKELIQKSSPELS